MRALRQRYGRAARGKVGKIEDTGLLPYAVADGVLDEIERATGDTIILKHTIAEGLSEKAENVFTRNPQFRQWIRSGAGREVLWSFMRHWASAELRAVQPGVYSKLPDSFKVGRALP